MNLILQNNIFKEFNFKHAYFSYEFYIKNKCYVTANLNYLKNLKKVTNYYNKQECHSRQFKKNSHQKRFQRILLLKKYQKCRQ